MTLTELRYIVAVARERHFGRAAAACFVSQPTLSVAVKKLEDELGVKIFERHPHDVSVTRIGERIVDQARLVLEQSKAIKSIAEEGRDELRGELRLGVIYTVGPWLLPRLIPLMHRRAPDLTLVIDEDFTGNLAQKLRNAEVDMVLVSLPFNMPSVRVEVLYEEPFVVALPRHHRLANRKSIRANDLQDEMLLLLRTGNCFREQVIAACPACQGEALSRHRIQRTLEGSSIETIRQMVAAGSGVTVLPYLAALDRGGINRMLDFRPFARPSPSREIALAWRASYPRPGIVQMLRQAIAACEFPGDEIRVRING
ncbi:MAG: LysR family transcriptional regulator [Gammaproteobacteria bacterium]|nr:LysR family transcriptional regulator [Gammaproteobacteria bacterium]